MKTDEAGYIIMSPFEFRQQMITIAKHSAAEALRQAGLDVKQVTKAEAYRRYKRWRVDRWLREHKITPVKQGGLVMLDVSELDALSHTSELFNKISNNHNRRSVGERSGQPESSRK